MVNVAILLKIVQSRNQRHHHAERTEEQEDTDSGEIEMFAAIVGLNRKQAHKVMTGVLTQVPVDHEFQSNILFIMITWTLKLENQLDLVMVVTYLLLKLVRSRSSHNCTMVKMLLVG